MWLYYCSKCKKYFGWVSTILFDYGKKIRICKECQEVLKAEFFPSLEGELDQKYFYCAGEHHKLWLATKPP